MKQNSKIKLYDTRTFTDKFMPSDELRGHYKGDYNEFLIVHVEDMYRHVGPGNFLILQSYLIALLCEIKEAYQPLEVNQQSASLILTNKFRELLFKYITTKHRVADYAQSYFSRLFKKYEGMTPLD